MLSSQDTVALSYGQDNNKRSSSFCLVRSDGFLRVCACVRVCRVCVFLGVAGVWCVCVCVCVCGGWVAAGVCDC
jgi:hypothetical protein